MAGAGTGEENWLTVENLGFGMFIHWGLYSQLAKGEWNHSTLIRSRRRST